MLDLGQRDAEGIIGWPSDQRHIHRRNVGREDSTLFRADKRCRWTARCRNRCPARQYDSPTGQPTDSTMPELVNDSKHTAAHANLYSG